MEDGVGYFRKLFVENVVGTFVNLQLGETGSQGYRKLQVQEGRPQVAARVPQILPMLPGLHPYGASPFTQMMM